MAQHEFHEEKGGGRNIIGTSKEKDLQDSYNGSFLFSMLVLTSAQRLAAVRNDVCMRVMRDRSFE